ncbi:MAG: hypothetical protein H7A23_01645 [Leptospiraceae bacterium]|nr:hypothetical protein [Leptospiraceae bacterium]MCP5493236.1 hypothetical protein [Leptospiraceae bacterium]
MSGKKVFDSRFQINIPTINNYKNIDYILYVSEHYIAKGDKTKVEELKTRLSSIHDHDLAVSIIDFFWHTYKKDFNLAEEIINKYLEQESNLYNALLASSLLELAGQNKTLSEESATSLRKTTCRRTKPYYSLCKVLKLVEQMEDLSILSNNIYYDYMLIDKAVASFSEESDLFYIYFFSRIAPELPIKMASLGFANEAGYFQKMLLQSENLYQFNVKSYERLAYYQLLVDDLDGANTTLRLIVDRLNASPHTKNNILLKLGAIAYFKKDYKSALSYYLSLDINSWSHNLVNPFFGEPLTINGLRDLVSVLIWQSKSSLNAVNALDSIKTQKEVTEDDLFLRLRIAHILMDDKPDTAEKISEEIIYIAQSRGWKRIEYAATLMNGFCHVLGKNYRKAVIQFTKSYGILGDSDPSFTVEWIREYGLLVSRRGTSKNFSADSMYSSIWSILKKEGRNDDIFTLRNYIDSRFNEASFFQDMVSYFIDRGNYPKLLEMMYSYQQKNARMTIINNRSIAQIPVVHNRIKLYKGFQLKEDSNHYIGSWYKLRDKIGSKLDELYHSFDTSVLEKVSDPFIAGLFHENRIYIFSYDPQSYKQKWNLKIYDASEFGSPDYYRSVYNSIDFLSSTKNVQIYMNPIGVDLYQYLKASQNLSLRLFYYFQKKLPNNKENQVVSVKCNNDTQKIEGVTYRPTEYFEGKKTIYDQGNVTWDFSSVKLNTNSKNILDYKWRCPSNSELSFQKMFRRVGLRITPESVLFTNNVFSKSTLDDISVEYYFWSEFWMKKGVNTLYYLDNVNWQDRSLINLLSQPINSSKDIDKIQKEFKILNIHSLVLVRNVL